MRDHPLGVGWNQAIGVYEKNYSPPKNGAAAITTNDYLMLGATLGVPALFCFGMYLWLTLVREGAGRGARGAVSQGQKAEGGKSGKREAGTNERGGEEVDQSLLTSAATGLNRDFFSATCHAGAMVLLVGFWFDGGLFKLPTAATFWILLELGAVQPQNCIIVSTVAKATTDKPADGKNTERKNFDRNVLTTDFADDTD
jgi:hypothetical protein